MTQDINISTPLISQLILLPGFQEERLRMLNSLGGESFLKKLISSAMDNICTRGEALVKALEDHDENSIRKLAHSIKSSSGNIGALYVMEAARDVEESKILSVKKARELQNKIRILQEQINNIMDKT